jgi:two-component system, chemotaxis family, chemotaxis protein CheY
MNTKRVLSVGQCCYDHGRITTTLRDLFGAEVVSADDEAEATRQLKDGAFALVLVNRVFDANGASGIEFIRRVREASSVPVMLVSNFEDAQREAVAAGALPGFGKAALGQAAMKDCLAGLLA